MNAAVAAWTPVHGKVRALARENAEAVATGLSVTKYQPLITKGGKSSDASSPRSAQSWVGGLADSVHDVLELSRDELREPPRIAMRGRADMIEGLGKKVDQFIIVLDIGRVFATDHSLLALDHPIAPEAVV